MNMNTNTNTNNRKLFSMARFCIAALLAVPMLLVWCSSSALAQTAPVATKKATTPKVALQLWSIKDEVRADFKKTLKTVAHLGFEGVEFAGDYGPYKDDPKGLKRFLKRLGLQVAGAHVGAAQLSPAAYDETVKFMRALDCPRLIISSDPRALKAETVMAFAAELSDLSQRLAQVGIAIGFHNHSGEMLRVKSDEAASFWDVIATNTPQQVVLQQDVGWTSVAGRDPVLVMQRYPGRTVSTHFKSKALARDSSSDFRPLIGQDSIAWHDLVRATRQVGGTEWIVLEQEDYPAGMSPIESVQASLQGLRAVMAEVDRAPQAASSTLTHAEQVRGWQSLFDGTSAKGWHRYGGGAPGRAWRFDAGEISLASVQKAGWQSADGGDIVSDGEYSQFHLQLEWKIAQGGNSGIFLFVNEDAARFPYAWNTGLEMQILDNARHPDGKITQHRAGDLYDLQAASVEAAKLPGEWNKVDIVVDAKDLDFYLNGRHIVHKRLWDQAWEDLIAKSKFAAMPGFGRFQQGRIGLQDHGDVVSFRNVRIRTF